MARTLLCCVALLAFTALAAAQANAPPYYFLYGPKPTPVAVRKVVRKTVKKVVKAPIPRPAPLSIACTVTPAALPQRIVNCKVLNKFSVPVCAHLKCTPNPGGLCATGNSAGVGPQPDCSWNIRPGCSSPTPVFPGGAWSFGFMTSWTGPINLAFPPWGLAMSSAINGTACPL